MTLSFFAEASCDKISVIKQCLNLFCDYSSEKVNVEKTRICMSRNVNHNIASQIRSISRFTLTGIWGNI